MAPTIRRSVLFAAMCVMSFISISANAEWTFLGATNQGSVYVDWATRQKSGAMVTVTDLAVFNTPAFTGTKAQSTVKEFNCLKETSRVIRIKTYDKQNTLTLDKSTLWDRHTQAEVGTMAYTLLKAVCS
jgi:hypothetical protein